MKDKTNPKDLYIRVGTPEDIDEIMVVAMQATEENGFLEASPEKLAQEIYPALCQDHGIVGLIGPKDGAIEGIVVLRIGTMWYSDAPVVEEKAIFVHPEFRSARGARARRLCDFSKKVSDTVAFHLLISILSNNRTKLKVRLY